MTLYVHIHALILEQIQRPPFKLPLCPHIGFQFNMLLSLDSLGHISSTSIDCLFVFSFPAKLCSVHHKNLSVHIIRILRRLNMLSRSLAHPGRVCLIAAGDIPSVHTTNIIEAEMSSLEEDDKQEMTLYCMWEASSYNLQLELHSCMLSC